MQMPLVFSIYGEGLKRVEEYLEGHLTSEVNLIPQVVHHLLGGGGKRFRPLLLLACADLCGYSGERRYALAAVIEFIHTATLLHDDVVDGAETRRGRASANHVWGNAASVLVGDYLYSQSFKILAEDGNMPIMNLLATCTNAMSEGEVLQLTKRGDPGTTEKDYLTIVEKKTAILISAACALGGMLGRNSDETILALARFGMRLGTAFQITDDILDYAAKEEEFGKAIGKDLAEGKLTLPLIKTLKKSNGPERELIRGVVERKELTDDEMGKIFDLIHKYDGIGYAHGKAASCIEEAKGYLSAFPESQAKTALLAISDYILSRRL